MQLPPTILSLDTNKKKKAKNKGGTSTVKPKGSNSLTTTASRSPPPPQVADEVTEEISESTSGTESIPEESEPQQDGLEEVAAALSLLTGPQKFQGSRPSLEPPRTLETTLFERLEKMYGARIKRMLTVQYR